MFGRLALAVALAVALLSVGAFGQQSGSIVATSGLVVVDQERLFADSLFGQRVQSELQSESNALAEENRRMEAELVAEELSLTDQRPNLSPAEFRNLANEFDARVTLIRLAQDRKSRALSNRQNAERQAFFEAALPVLQQLLQQAGASAMLDRRSVLISLSAVDVTDRAIAQIDAILGDGVGLILENQAQPIQTDRQD